MIERKGLSIGSVNLIEQHMCVSPFERWAASFRCPYHCTGMKLPSSVQFLLPFCSILLPCLAPAQFSGPESVEYDPVGDRYFVSNTQSSSIKALTYDGTVIDFSTGLPDAPYGLEIMGEVLYACMGDGIRGYSLSSGEEVYERGLGASFPNGITTDGEFLYVTDFGSQRILKVDPIGDSHTVLVADTEGTPNGIVSDPTGDRLVVVFWGSNAPIKEVDRNTGELNVLLANSGLGNIDGITIDCFGNFLTASWAPSQITTWDPEFSGPGIELAIAGIGNPADIDFDQVNDRIAIPNTSLHTVVLHEMDCSTGVPDQQKAELVVIPNPVTDRVHVLPAFEEMQPYIILDGRGSLIGGGTLRPNGIIDLEELPPGAYVLHFTQANRLVRLVKQ